MKREESGIPEFRSLEEEREYWEARGPLAAGQKAKVNRPRPGQPRSSFLAVRLTGEELTRLRDFAESQGMGPSTFARSVLLNAIERKGYPGTIRTLDEMTQAFEESLPQETKDRMEALFKAIAIGNPPILLELTDKEKLEAFSHFAVATLLSIFGIQVAHPGTRQSKESAVTSTRRTKSESKV